jgi:hypothetical protein
MAYRIPASGQHVEPALAQQFGQRDQRQADERSRSLGVDARRSARCRGLRPWRCRRSRRAARAAGSARSAARSGAGRQRGRAPSGIPGFPDLGIQQHRPRCRTRPSSRCTSVSWRTALSWLPGLSSSCALAGRHLVGADDAARRENASRRARALAFRQAQRRRAGAHRAPKPRPTCGLAHSKGIPRRSSSPRRYLEVEASTTRRGRWHGFVLTEDFKR